MAMLTRRQNLPQSLSASENISILLISAQSEDEQVLREMLPGSFLHDFTCYSRVDEAVSQICSAQPSVVICERDLPDGNWKAILGTCEALPFPPAVLVVSRHADENLWAEVLNLGGFDVLLKPFDRTEVTRVVGSSCRQWSGNFDTKPAIPESGNVPQIAQYA